MTSGGVGLVGAGSLLGLAGSALVGKLADQVGRRRMLMINMYLFSIFSLLQLVTTNMLVLFILRLLIGLMIAIDYTVGNAWLVEWIPAKQSGKLQSQLIIYWTLGFIASYLAGTFISGLGAHTWLIILATSAVPGIITAIYRSLFGLPASPSWLASQGKNQKAQKVIQKHLGKRWGCRSSNCGVKHRMMWGLKHFLAPLTGGGQLLAVSSTLARPFPSLVFLSSYQSC